MITLPTKKTTITGSVKDHIILVYGPPGVGKSTFTNGLADNVLFISTDRGSRHLKALRVEVGTWQEIDRVITMLENQKRKGELAYDMVALDHVDDISNIVELHVCSQLGVDSLEEVGFGKGWRAHRKELWKLLQRILNLGTGLVLIAHESIKTLRMRKIETERIMPDLSKGAWKVVIPICDIVGYCGFRTIKTGQIRIITTQPTESIYAKDRTLRTHPESGWELLKGLDFVATFGRARVSR